MLSRFRKLLFAGGIEINSPLPPELAHAPVPQHFATTLIQADGDVVTSINSLYVDRQDLWMQHLTHVKDELGYFRGVRRSLWVLSLSAVVPALLSAYRTVIEGVIDWWLLVGLAVTLALATLKAAVYAYIRHML